MADYRSTYTATYDRHGNLTSSVPSTDYNYEGIPDYVPTTFTYQKA